MKILLTALLLPLAAFCAGRRVTTLSEGWTADGVPVTVPHTWNATDGEDGLSAACNADLVARQKGLKSGDYEFDEAVFQRNSARNEGGYVRKAVVYRHALPDPKPDRRYFVRCAGASITADVLVNRTVVGRHLGAYAAFCYELTESLAPSNNVLTIVVDNRWNPDLPTLSADFTVFGGLYREVELIETPKVCIDPTYYGGPGVSVSTDPATGEVSVDVRISGGAAKATYAVGDLATPESRFRLPDFNLWSPETPVVYELAVTLDSGDSVRVPFGFRSVAFDAEGRFRLNGRVRKLRGVNRHQHRQGKGWAISAADDEEDFALIREMGADAVRTAHYPQSRHVYDLTDRLGFVVWCEVPVTDCTVPSVAYAANVETMIREMVAQHGNHPSICLWSLFNELRNGWSRQSADGPMAEAVRAEQRLFKALDPSRPTVAAGCKVDAPYINDIPDALAINTYPGWYFGTGVEMAPTLAEWLDVTRRKAIGVSEYGAGASIRHHALVLPSSRVEPKGAFHPEELQAAIHERNWRTLSERTDVWGTFVWAMFDFASDGRSEGDRSGINDKGLVTADRKERKDAFWFYKANWTQTPVLRIVGQRATEANAENVPVTVYSNVGDVTLSVNGQPLGTVRPDAFRCAKWANVALRPGENIVEARAGGHVARAIWRSGPFEEVMRKDVEDKGL